MKKQMLLEEKYIIILQRINHKICFLKIKETEGIFKLNNQKFEIIETLIEKMCPKTAKY